MRNILLEERSARDIDEVVAKILRDLENPRPPLPLEIVRDLLALDRAYYSSTNTDMLRETVHRLRIGAKQVIRRPSLLLDVVRKRDLRALWVPDRRRILIDSDLPSPKQRWGEAHEVGHSIIPWHDAMMHGDHARTLSVACEEILEAEANYAAGRLLFLQDEFNERLLSGPVSFSHIKDLSKEFGNTMTSTLWRAIETLEVPAFGLVTGHPKAPVAKGGKPLVRYFLRSPAFAERFATVTDIGLFNAVRRITRGNKGPIGAGEVVIYDAASVQHIFFMEVFFNGYDALTLGIYRRERVVSVSFSR